MLVNYTAWVNSIAIRSKKADMFPQDQEFTRTHIYKESLIVDYYIYSGFRLSVESNIRDCFGSALLHVRSAIGS